MRLSVSLIALYALCLSSAVFGQQAKLEGNVYEIKDGKESLVSTPVRIIVPGTQTGESDSKGHFLIPFPATVQPGIPTRIDINRDGWAIYEPLMGNCVTQSTAKNLQPLKVILVEKHSPMALSPKRLNLVIAQWSSERTRLSSQVKEQRRELEEYAFLKEYAEKFGFTLEQFRQAADLWAKTKDSDDKEERALKEYWLKNYNSAALLAHDAALDADDELERANKDRIEASRKVIRRYHIEGNARYEELAFREAAAAYSEIDKRFSTRKISKEDFLEEWAETKVLLGNAKQELGIRVEGRESQVLLAEAMAAYREALKVHTREQLPQDWATTQNNLGAALWSQGERSEGADGVRLLGEAVVAFREILKVQTREQLPQDWAMAQNNLGNALSSQGERAEGADGVRLLDEGVAAFREALKVYTREQLPQQWAMTQNNLGLALKSQGERAEGADGVRLLGEAVQSYREALKVHTRDQLPQQWAATQNNLGAALRSQGERAEGADGVRLLGEAVAAYREALKVRTREQLPQDWAGTQSNLGVALRSQGERAEGVDGVRLLDKAVAAYREALKVYTREQLPQQWATTQNNLGNALSSQGERAEGADGVRLLGEAVVAYREALKVRTREQLPQDWAMTQNNLGTTLSSQGERAEGADGVRLLDKAVTAYREALKVYTREQLPQQWAATQNNLGVVLKSQGDRAEGTESLLLLGEAVQAYREVLKVYTREQLPQDWAGTQNNLGVALRSQGERVEGADGVRLLGEAVAAFREALKVYTREQLPQLWAITQNNLGKAYLLLENWKGSAVSFENVLSLLPTYQPGYQSLTSIYHERLFEYAMAFELHQRWLSRFPQDTSVLPDFTETHFTTGRFSEFSQRVSPLLADSQLSPSTKIALRMIEIANLLALDSKVKVPLALSELDKFISEQKGDFRIRWTFNGTLHFINQEEKFITYRSWLNQFFRIAQGENREAILKALREAHAQSPK